MHRDIKPSNFALGDSSQIFIIDYGLAKPYLTPDAVTHIPLKENRGFIGTERYASVSTHKGFEQSRRSDVESLGYMLAYFAAGSLPWQRFASKAKHHGKMKIIAQLKESFSSQDAYGNYPREIIQLIKYARSLKFEECPNYESLRERMRGKYQRVHGKFVYDWEMSTGKLRHSSSVPNSVARHELKGSAKANFNKKNNNFSRKTSHNISIYGINKNYNTIARAQDSFHVGIQCKEDPPLDCSDEDPCPKKHLKEVEDDIPEEKEIPITIKIPICIHANPKKSAFESKGKKLEVATSECFNVSTEDHKAHII